MSNPRSGSPDETFAALLESWNGNDPAAVRDLVTDDYAGHMLHLGAATRGRDEYPAWIARWRELNPGARFVIDQQIESGDWIATRLRAVRAAHGVAQVAFGMNFARRADDRVAEEWAIWTEWRAE